MRFDTGADRIVLWVRLAYAREYVIQHYAYAPVSKRIARELSWYDKKKSLKTPNGLFIDSKILHAGTPLKSLHIKFLGLESQYRFEILSTGS